MTRVLIVDDDPVFLTAIRLLLEQEGLAVQTAAAAAEAIALAKQFPPDVLVTDWLLRGAVDGVELAGRVHQAGLARRVILITGWATAELRQQVAAWQGAALLEKPFSPDDLLAAVRGGTAAGP